MSIYEKFLEVMADKNYNGHLFLSDCLITKYKGEEMFARRKRHENGVLDPINQGVKFGKDSMIKLCDMYSNEIELHYDRIKGVEKEETLGRAM